MWRRERERERGREGERKREIATMRNEHNIPHFLNQFQRLHVRSK